jgi:hypothetical protein
MSSHKKARLHRIKKQLVPGKNTIVLEYKMLDGEIVPELEDMFLTNLQAIGEKIKEELSRTGIHTDMQIYMDYVP